MRDDKLEVNKLWSREPPERERPIRGAGGFYRTADGKEPGSGGVSLHTVRLAYKVAEVQVDRSARLASRLREAGDRAVGPGSDRQALDATEKLVMKALLSGLAWWEGSVAEGRCPVKRLAVAEYQMLGQMLGLTQPDKPKAAATHSPEQDTTRAKGRGAEESQSRRSAPPRLTLQIMHKGTVRERRPVLVASWEIAETGAFRTPVFFYSVQDITAEPLEAELVLSGKRSNARLIIQTPRHAAPGPWRGAICDAEALQVGFIEIIL
jgi:hypothetical protein